MEAVFNLHTLEDQVKPDEEGFLEAGQEFGCKLQIYTTAGEVTAYGDAQ